MAKISLMSIDLELPFLQASVLRLATHEDYLTTMLQVNSLTYTVL